MSTVRILTGSHIRISKNDHIECGMYFDLQVYCIYPMGRKAHRSTFTVSAGAVVLTQLHSGRAGASVSPADFRALVAALPVRSDSQLPVHVTPEVEAQARAYFTVFADRAEKQMAEAHPNFKPDLVPAVLVPCTMTTNDKLKACGLDKRDAVGYAPALGIKDVFQTIAPDKVLFTGRASAVDAWVESQWPGRLLSHREERALAE